jgi:acyl carrier protein
MTPQEFLAKFAAQFEETDPTTIFLDTKFRAIDEWSSLMALVVIAMVDEEMGVKLTGDEIKNSQTVNDLYTIVAGKK